MRSASLGTARTEVYSRFRRGVPTFLNTSERCPVFAGFLIEKPQFFVKFDYIVDYLKETVGPTGDGAGATDQRINKMTESGLAKTFRRYICGLDGDDGCDFFKMDEDDQLYIFNGQYYEIQKEEILQEIIIEAMVKMDVGLVYQMNSAKAISSICMNKLKTDLRCRFEPDRRYVCFKNGIFDCQTGKLNDFNVKYKTDIVLDFNYIPDAKSALWDKVLVQTVPDEGMRETFHQFCGCFLAKRSEYKIEYITFVVGEGQNGKSIICKAVVNTLGRAVASSYSPEQLFRSKQAEYHLADVNGKIVNYCDDVSNKDFSGGDFKAFVSGGEFTGRHPYSQRPTRVTKVPLMLCCANNIPPTTDDTEGYFRRFLIILAPNHIDERDKDVTLEKKLMADDVRAAIFNWMYEGYKAFVKNEGKVVVADSVKEVVTEMRESANSLQRWLSDNNYAYIDPKDSRAQWKSLNEWCKEYRDYCEEEGDTVKAKRAVILQFKNMKLEKKRMSDGVWYCMGKVYRQIQDKEEEPAFVPEYMDESKLPFN